MTTSTTAGAENKVGSATAPSDPYRQLFLQNVEAVMKQKPRLQTLTSLLKLANPDFTQEGCSDADSLGKAMKTLKLRLHPDKHVVQGDEDVATKLFQKLDGFHRAAMENSSSFGDELGEPPAKRPRNGNSSSSTSTSFTEEAGGDADSGRNFPPLFDVFDSWKYINTDSLVEDADLACAVNCANIRAQIAHTRPLPASALYSADRPIASANITNLHDPSVSAIKTTLIMEGPVVSKSFICTQQFAESLIAKCQNPCVSHLSARHLRSCIGRPMPVLITGWTNQSFGEAWTVSIFLSLAPPHVFLWKTVMPVVFHQFDIQRLISFVPQTAIVDIPWLVPRPYLAEGKFYIEQTDGNGFTVSVTTQQQLREVMSLAQQALKCLPPSSKCDNAGGIIEAARVKAPIEYYVPGRRSDSWTVCLQDLALVDAPQSSALQVPTWEVKFAFVQQKKK
ncbi:unnamed protein product [Amoebophrya sp. A120]|nr:unnamed protein product [Amoebophrya sp. A120]|eukprot:GSA120T00003023001.1